MDPFATSLIFLGLYLIPGINAYSRHHKNAAAIMTLNVVLGWTVIGWLGALVWSMTASSKETAK